LRKTVKSPSIEHLTDNEEMTIAAVDLNKRNVTIGIQKLSEKPVDEHLCEVVQAEHSGIRSFKIVHCSSIRSMLMQLMGQIWSEEDLSFSNYSSCRISL